MPSLMDAVTARMKRPPWPPPAATPPAAPLSAPSSREEGDYPDLWRLMAMLYQRQVRHRAAVHCYVLHRIVNQVRSQMNNKAA